MSKRIGCRKTSRSGLTLLELLVVVAIIGVVCALLLPSVGVVRESSRRVTCVSRLREFGIGIQHHHDAMGELPRGWTEAIGQDSAYGWGVRVLPFMEQGGLRDSVDFRFAISDDWHATARGTSLDMFMCPSDISEPFFGLYPEGSDAVTDRRLVRSGDQPLGVSMLTRLPAANYVGVYGVRPPERDISKWEGRGPMVPHRTVRFSDFYRGTSLTFLVGERTAASLPSTWLGVSLFGENAIDRMVGSACDGLNLMYGDVCNFSSRHPHGVNFLWGDGHVSFVSEQIDIREFRQMARLE